MVIARVRDMESMLHTPSQFFCDKSPCRGGIAKVLNCLKLKLEIYEMIFFSIVLAFKLLLYVVFTD